MLLTVRLNAEEEKLVKGMRRRKQNVSELVRRAIRAEARKTSTRSRRESLQRVFERFPDPAGSHRSDTPRSDDPRGMRAFIVNHLTRSK